MRCFLCSSRRLRSAASPRSCRKITAMRPSSSGSMCPACAIPMQRLHQMLCVWVFKVLYQDQGVHDASPSGVHTTHWSIRTPPFAAQVAHYAGCWLGRQRAVRDCEHRWRGEEVLVARGAFRGRHSLQVCVSQAMVLGELVHVMIPPWRYWRSTDSRLVTLCVGLAQVRRCCDVHWLPAHVRLPGRVGAARRPAQQTPSLPPRLPPRCGGLGVCGRVQGRVCLKPFPVCFVRAFQDGATQARKPIGGSCLWILQLTGFFALANPARTGGRRGVPDHRDASPMGFARLCRRRLTAAAGEDEGSCGCREEEAREEVKRSLGVVTCPLKLGLVFFASFTTGTGIRPTCPRTHQFSVVSPN